MAGKSITPISRGVMSQPTMDFETTELTAISSTLFGNGNPSTLQAVTVNSVGGSGMSVQIWKLTAATTSASISTMSHAPGVTGATFWYNAACPFGFIVNWLAGVGDLTISYRENQ
jgi:hypothetical protein